MADTFMEEFRKRAGVSDGPSLSTNQPSATSPPSSDSFMQEFRSRASGVSTPAVADGPASIAPAVLPRANQALSAVSGGMSFVDTSEQDKQADQAYIAKNQAPGVELNTQDGADALTRLATGAHRNKIEKLNVLRKMHGEDSVRLDTEGNFILRGKDEAGKPKDLVVDERNMSAKDFLDVASEYPAFAMSMLTTKGIPAGQIFKSALRGALGYFAGGAIGDAAVRGGTGQDIDPNEIIGERGPQVLSDTGFGYGLGKGISAIGMIPKLSRLAASNLSDVSREGAMAEIEAGRQGVKSRFGVEMEPSMAELTGNPMVVRLESFLSNIPIARNMVLKKWQRQLENEKAVQIEMGMLEANPTRTGQGLIDVLGGELGRKEAQLGKASDIVRRQGTESVTEPLEGLGPITPFQFGSRMIKRGEAQLQSFKNRASEKYAAIKAQPDAELPVFNVSPIKKEAEDIAGSELVSKPTSSGGTEPIKQLIPSGVDPVLSAISELPNSASYFDLVKLRQAIYDRLDSPEPVSSRGTYLLKRLGATVTREMNTQGDKVLQPATRALIKDANQFYSKNVDTFYQKGVQDMLKPRTEAGAVDPELVASRLLAGGKGSVTTYNTLKSFFENPGAVKDMNRMLRHQIIDSGTDSATGLVKLEDLSTAVSKMEPEIVEQLFGKPKDQLVRVLQQSQMGLRTGTKGFSIPERGTQVAIESDQLKLLFDAEKLETRALRDLVMSAENLKSQYSNAIRKATKANDLGIIEAAPETFAKDYLFNPSVPLRDVRDVMQSIYRNGDVDLISDVRRAYLNEIFSNSAREVQGDARQIVDRIKGSPLRDLDPQKLAIQMQSQATRERLTEILGEEGFDGLQDFAKSISGKAVRDAAGRMSGIFTGGSLFEKLLNGLEGLSEVPRYLALSWFVTSPKVISAFRTASKIAPDDLSGLAKKLVLTPEFLRVVTSDASSPEEAASVVKELQAMAPP